MFLYNVVTTKLKVMKRHTFPKVSKERAIQIILNTEPALTEEIVKNYTDSEIKEWMRMLGFQTNF